MRHHWPEDKRNSEQEGSQVKQRKGTSIILGIEVKVEFSVISGWIFQSLQLVLGFQIRAFDFHLLWTAF